MNLYSPPQSLTTHEQKKPVPLFFRLMLFPVFVIGACITSQTALWAFSHLSVPAGTKDLKIAFLVTQAILVCVAGAALWWFPLAVVYRKRSFLISALVALGPVLLHLVLAPALWASPVAITIYLINTAGFFAALVFGTLLFANRLGANNSFKPMPLRGTA